MPRPNRNRTRTSAWLSEATRRKLRELQEIHGTQAEVFAVAIDRLHAAEIGERVSKNEVATENTRP